MITFQNQHLILFFCGKIHTKRSIFYQALIMNHIRLAISNSTYGERVVFTDKSQTKWTEGVEGCLLLYV